MIVFYSFGCPDYMVLGLRGHNAMALEGGWRAKIATACPCGTGAQMGTGMHWEGMDRVTVGDSLGGLRKHKQLGDKKWSTCNLSTYCSSRHRQIWTAYQATLMSFGELTRQHTNGIWCSWPLLFSHYWRVVMQIVVQSNHLHPRFIREQNEPWPSPTKPV